MRTMASDATGPIRVHLVVGAPTHDTNFVRLQLLQALHRDERIWVTIGDDFSDIDTIAAADALVVYTCNVSPADAQLDALDAMVERGGRIFAMHATNALIRFTDGPPIVAQGIGIPGQVDTTDTNPRFTRLLGSRFLAHLLLQPMTVQAVSDNPLVAGIAPFEVTAPTAVTMFGVGHQTLDEFEIGCLVHVDRGAPIPRLYHTRRDIGLPADARDHLRHRKATGHEAQQRSPA